MSTRSGGSFAALLMSGPLAAIPLMAMFGVPQFSTVSASTDDESDGVLRRPQVVTAQSEQSPDVTDFAVTSTSPKSQDLNPAPIRASEPNHSPRPITPVGFFASTSPTPQTNSSASDAAPSAPFVTEPATPPTSVATAPVPISPRARPTPTTLTTSPAPPAQRPTWENAAQKLLALGIEDYRLERGQDGETFLFICQFAPGADTRIIRRFEAEAREPAVAVQKVLQRITDWQATSSTH